MPLNTTQIILQDHIPWTNEEIVILNKKMRVVKLGTMIFIYATIPVMVFIIWLTREHFYNYLFFDYLLLSAVILAIYVVLYFLLWFLTRLFLYPLQKDFKNGKCVLNSFITSKDKTDNDEYFFTFEGIAEYKKIRLALPAEAYKKYIEGTWLTIEYLKYTKEILKIVDI